MRREAANPDDQETDIVDDPLVGKISGELHTINRTSDRKLLIALALNLALVLLYTQSPIRSVWLDWLGGIVVIAIIGGTITSVVRQKQRVAERHGLVCPACSYRPAVSMMLSAATTQRCRKCKTPLPVV